MSDTVLTLLVSMGGGAITGVISVIAMKTDIVWIKETLREHGGRLNNLERKKQ